jgi:hypothetical protein
MANNTMPPPPGVSTMPAPGRAASGPGALISALAIIVGSAILGLVGGLIWAAVSPRVVYQVYTLHPPTAYAVNPETSAFIATDGYYTIIALIGGALIGVLSYVFAVRRYGPVPMVGVILGSTAAAFIAKWIGHRQTGAAGFNRVLATSKAGEFLHAPINLGAHGALAFWPLAAAVIAGGLELISVLRARRQEAYRSTSRWSAPGAPWQSGSAVEEPRPDWRGESGPPSA